ncbi:hypothetical protein BHM03_00030145 [Ensete ventricosum]|nr:hypothetical protein BHM03_00030145 [Ensete ventricosum]
MSESESRWRGIVDGQVGESGGREERIRRRPGVGVGVGVCGSDGHTGRHEIAPSAERRVRHQRYTCADSTGNTCKFRQLARASLPSDREHGVVEIE